MKVLQRIHDAPPGDAATSFAAAPPPPALQVMERWLVNPYPGQTGILSPKEAILMVQRLAALEKLNLFDHVGTQQQQQQAAGPATGGGGAGTGAPGANGGGGAAGGVSALRRAWDSTLLSLVMRLATPPPEPPVGQARL